MELLEVEELTALIGDLYAMLAEFWFQAGFPARAIELMEVVLENRMAFRGVDHPKVEKARSVLARLRKTSDEK